MDTRKTRYAILKSDAQETIDLLNILLQNLELDGISDIGSVSHQSLCDFTNVKKDSNTKPLSQSADIFVSNINTSSVSVMQSNIDPPTSITYSPQLQTTVEENVECTIEVPVSTPQNINNSRVLSVENESFYSPNNHIMNQIVVSRNQNALQTQVLHHELQSSYQPPMTYPYPNDTKTKFTFASI